MSSTISTTWPARRVARWVALFAAGLVCAGCKSSGSVSASSDGVRAKVGDSDDDRRGGAGQWDEDGDGSGAGRSVEGHAKSGARIATLPGFRIFEDGRSRVFVELTGPPTEVRASRSEWRLVYHLEGVSVPERVNRMDMPTTHFNTPVRRIRLVQVGTSAELVIELRDRVEPRVHLNKSNAGTVLSVDFPPVDDRTDEVSRRERQR